MVELRFCFFYGSNHFDSNCSQYKRRCSAKNGISVCDKEKMELFQFVKKCYQTIGICNPPQSNDRRIMLKKYFFISSMTLMFMSNIGYFFYEASTIAAYGNSFFISCSELLTLIAYLICAWQISYITQLIDSYQAFLEESQLIFSEWKWPLVYIYGLLFVFRTAAWVFRHYWKA